MSKMAWMAAWKAMLKLGFEEAVIASCQFESIHKKEFRFLLYMLCAQRLERRCPGGHEHVKIEGSLTEGVGSIYVATGQTPGGRVCEGPEKVEIT